MKPNLRSLAALAAVALAAASALAQSMPNAPYLSVAQRSTFLLANPFELKKVNLTATQHQSLRKILADYATKQNKVMAAKEPSTKEMEANDKTYSTACLKLLTSDQADRLLAIGVKQIGTDALKDPSICAKIGLGSGQVHKISDIAQNYSKRAEDVDAMVGAAMEQIPEPKPGTDRKDYEKKQTEVYNSYEGERRRLEREKAQADKDILAIMTPEQKAKWMSIAGASARTTKQ